jgi:hypothetical protein
MATWIAHIRIAEHFLNKYIEKNTLSFLVGNIAPDSGVPNEDWSKFTPDGNISHWKIDGKNIDADDFKMKYLKKYDENYYFYLGYYFHLLTDIEWQKFFNKKKLEPVYYDGLNKDSNFIWTIKKDWYGQDEIYLKQNPNSIFFTVFAKINNFENKYLGIFSKDAFLNRINFITNRYINSKENVNREFPYLKKEEMDYFVNNTIDILEKIYQEL